MAEAGKPDRPSRFSAAAFPWVGRRRKRVRADGRPPSPKPTARRIVSLAAGGAVSLALVIGLVWLAILYMPLPASQVIPRVQSALQERLGPDYAVTIADAELRRGGEGVELSLVDLEIAKTGGPVVASVPRAELQLDGFGLLSGDVRVQRVHVTSPKLDMRFDTTVDAASKNSDLPDRILAAIGDLDRLLGKGGAAGALEEVEVSGATLLVAPRARAPLALEGVDLRLSRGEGGALALTASSARSDDRWTTAVTVTATAPDGSRTIDLGLENVDLAPYSAPLTEKAGASPAKGRISGHLNARIGAGATLIAAEGRLDGRGLELSMPGPAPKPDAPPKSISVDLLQLALRWDPEARSLRIEPSQIRGRGGQAVFTGGFGAPKKPGEPWTAAIDARDVLLSGETAGDPPLRLDQIDVAATFDPASGALEISRAQFLGPTAKAAATGFVKFDGASPAVRLGLVGTPMPASAVKRLWPFFLADSIRNWVIENFASGRIDSLSLTIDVPAGALATLGPHDPLPVGSMSLDIAFSDSVLRGGAGMPWIEGAKGRIVASARNVEATIEHATFAGGDGEGALAVQNVVFAVPDLSPRYPKARLTLKSDGSLRRALSIVGSGAFGTNPLPTQLDVAKVTGEVTTDLGIDLELGHEKDAPKPVIRAVAEMRDVKIVGVFAGRNFEKGTLRLDIGDKPPTVSGKGVVGGAAATVAVTETPAADQAPARRKLAIKLTADAADLQRLGLDVPGTLKGEVPLSAEISLDDQAAPMAVSADLANVGIDGLVPGFKKPAGRAGRLAFLVEKGSDKTTIKDFVLESGDRSVRGTIEFNAKGELLAATLPIYRPGVGDDAKIEIDKVKGGLTNVAVQGAALDLKPLLDKLRGKPGAGGAAASTASGSNTTPKNLEVSAKLGTGLGYGGEAVAGLDLQLSVRNGKVTNADGSGRIGAAPIKLATSDDGRLALSGGDAGAFLRFADLYGRVDGGAFDLRASLSGGPGLLRIRQFAVRNDTALERVRRTTGADQSTPAASVQRGATRFDRLQVAFVQSPGQIQVEEAVVYGPQLGATLQGTVNYAADRVDLVGTFVPIYALNNLISRVPIIGALLGGGKNGGLLGVTFQVRGQTGAPSVTINPMSAVAPGFLRKMFEFRQQSPAGDAAATGSTRPPASASGSAVDRATSQ